MNIEEVKERVNSIDQAKGDDELAHVFEDDLHCDFIFFIAQQNLGEISEMAKEILKTGDIDFNRWCA